MKKFFLILLIIISSLLSEDFIEYDYELDAYYSNVSAFIDLEKDRNITNGTDYNELTIYKNLFLQTFSPNIFLVEAAVHPMPVAGLYINKNHRPLYDDFTTNDMNLVQAITAGFEEPYSLSFFVGRMMVFQKNLQEKVGKNRAYMGTLVTIGDKSIKENVAHNDKWVNVEFKLKGTREKLNHDLDWSFRVGGRFHENKDFSNSIFIGARRKSIDYKKSIWSFVHNSAYSFMVAVDSESFLLHEMDFMVEKQWPTGYKKASFGLALGYLYYSQEKYKGVLRDEGINNSQVYIRPNFKW